MSEESEKQPPAAPATPSVPAPSPSAPASSPVTGPRPPHGELAAPTDGLEPIPLWMVTFFGILIFWGGWYLARYVGDWRSDMLEEDPAALRIASATSIAGEDPVTLGKRIYTGNCAVCHQSTGLGVPGQYPPLAGSEWLAGNPGRIKRLVLHGGEGLIEVKGSTYNNAMPAFGAKLTDKQIAAVLTFVRGNKDWGNSSEAISPEAVAATRQATKARSNPWSPAELLAIDTDESPAAPASAPASGPTSTSAPASGLASTPAK